MNRLNPSQFDGPVEVHGHAPGDKTPSPAEIRTFHSHKEADGFLKHPDTKAAPLKYHKAKNPLL